MCFVYVTRHQWRHYFVCSIELQERRDEEKRKIEEHRQETTHKLKMASSKISGGKKLHDTLTNEVAMACTH